jgi:signal transduction histidine kinase
MSNDLFERFLVSGKKETELDPPQEIRYVLEDTLSELVFYLESQGYRIECGTEWPKGKIAVSMDYISRIFNNISSNILKYADPAQPVSIRYGVQNKRLELTFENKIRKMSDDSAEVESTKIGLSNIRLMMQKMNGDSASGEDGNHFRIALYFPAE